MSRQDRDLVKTLLHDVLEAPPCERLALLDAACAGRPELRCEVEALLRASDDAGEFLAAPTEGPVDAAAVLDAERAAERGEPAELPRALGRYEVLGEVASGGMGVVLRARDVDLGRDVAVKMLRAEVIGDDAMVERFVEEAQIGGQLQHPGIVPIYEMVMQAGERPFFTMKLVEGQTLAALLRARAGPGADLHRLLAVFEQVCQTVAFAHSRGVIHRDLKPSNVMVGEFGEVQVVDWGFAKVMGAGDARPDAGAARPARAVRTVRSGSSGSASRAGSAMGTPAYMPPEQARGEVEHMDPRSDVFGLGGILCEILTGEPPYVRGAESPLEQAARGQTAPAFARLDGCGADPELVALARRCLSPRREDRPADARAVADAVAAYRSGVAERTRRAEIAAAEAKVRARAERRSRRLTTVLAAVVVAAVVLGAGGWAVLAERERARERQAADTVAVALAEAGDLLAICRHAPRAELGRWEAAEAAARRAVDLAERVAAAAEVRSRAAAALATVAGEARAARADAALLERLEAIRLRRGDDADLGRTERDYAAVFAPFGVGDEAVAPDEAGARIRASGLAAELVAALDDWSWVRGRTGAPRVRLAAIADRADDDAWRRSVRAAALEGDRARLVEAAGRAGPAALAGSTPNLLALHLGEVGERPRGVEVLQRARRQRLDDFWIHFQLGFELSLLVPSAWEQAVACFRVALADRPQSVEARHQLGIALFALGRYREAIEVWEDALAVRPGWVHAYDHLIEAHEADGTLVELVAGWEADCAAAPDDSVRWFRLGRALEVKDEWDRVADCYRRAAACDPEPSWLWVHLGYAEHYRADLDAAIDCHRRALELDDANDEAWAGIARARGHQGDDEAALAAVARAIELDPHDPRHRELAANLHRSRRDFAAARAALAEVLRVRPDYESVHLQLGELALEEGYPGRALPLLERALALPERYAESRFEMSTLFYSDPVTRRPRRGAALDEGVPRVATYRVKARAHRMRGELAEAREALGEVLRRTPPDRQSWIDHFTLGYVVLRPLGDLEGTARHMRAVLARHDDAFARECLAFALIGLGRYGDGAAELARVAEHASYDAAPGLRERFRAESGAAARLAHGLPAILDGSHPWADAREQWNGGWLCMELGYSLAAARLFDQAMRTDPELAGEPMPWPARFHRATFAAIAAAWAAHGMGRDAADLGGEARSLWRGRALAWLRSDLARWRRRTAEGSDGERAEEVQMLGEQVLGMALLVVTLPGNIEALPAAERAAWTDYVAAVRARLSELRQRR